MQCVICEEGITNPISAARLVEQIEAWLIDIQRDLRKDLQDYMKVIQVLPTAGWSIHNEEMKICAHCFTKEMFALIKSKFPEHEETFMRQFNYQLVEY